MSYYIFKSKLKFVSRLAIKTCEVTNQDDSKNLYLIQDFCETDESDPIIRKNPLGKFSNIRVLEKCKFLAENDAKTFDSFLFQIFKFSDSDEPNRCK